MKKLFIILTIAIMASCNNNSPNLGGEWRSNNGTYMTISQENNNYFVKIAGSDFMGKFEVDKIKIESPLGDIKYSKEKDRLYFGGEEFVRKEFLEAEVRRIQADKESYNGVWKNISHYDIMVIELMENGRFKIYERDSRLEEVGEFRNVQYDNGKITGTYYIEFDSEFISDFIINKIDDNTIRYNSPNSHDEDIELIYKRFIETDNYTGKWRGYEISYTGSGEVIEAKEPTYTVTISKEINKYRIIVDRGFGSKADIYFGNLKGNKIVVEGNQRDFYKLQIPTIELLPNGTLMLSEGIGNVRLKPVK